MRKLSIRKCGGQTYEVGIGQTTADRVVRVTAQSKSDALRIGRKEWRQRFERSEGA